MHTKITSQSQDTPSASSLFVFHERVKDAMTNRDKTFIDPFFKIKRRTTVQSPESKTCEYCENEGTISEPNGTLVCQGCHDNCPHDEIECGECQDCGAHISDFMDEDYGRD